MTDGRRTGEHIACLGYMLYAVTPSKILIQYCQLYWKTKTESDRGYRLITSQENNLLRLLQLHNTCCSTRGQKFKLKKQRSRLEVAHGEIFQQQVMSVWNGLRKSRVVEVETVNNFNDRHDS